MSNPALRSELMTYISLLLAEARERTLTLVAPLSDEDLVRQHDPLMGPLLWDVGHIGHFEELWLTQNLDGEIRFSEMPGTYNPFENPRRTRGALEYPPRVEMLTLLADIRSRVLERLDAVDFEAGSELVRDGYVYHMVLQHEYQHNETMLQTCQLKQGEPYRAPRAWNVPPRTLDIPSGKMVRFAGGEVVSGTEDRSEAYDNERPRHIVRLRPFVIDAVPTTNGDYLQFMDAGGYAKRELWSEAGWAWLTDAGVEAPKYWYREGGEWHTRSMDRAGPVDHARPVCHVSYHEAEAYARWAGKRLPSEAEWEAAAGWDESAGTNLKFPWGDDLPTERDANVDQLAFETAPVGAYPRNVSPLGCYGMIGDVWEWTSSDFAGYPGFQAFPYPEYSQVFFGPEYKVLRGGSWATRPRAVRNTFRNWDYPIRRQIFSGFRCASDD
ncbi:MAG TPA: ergothioneine biosynthesis protein EgtB [Gemmatimonadaceae bacterium]|nr:ergothioneine biosynthesis protein EgtB [Gemmatimonadaceae bacterium]